MDSDSVKAVEKILNYSFVNKNLLKEAITHSSSSDSPSFDFERLMFVGEAVLALALTNHIYFMNPKLEPSELSKLKKAVTSEERYACVAVKHGIYKFVEHNVPMFETRIKLLCNLVESVAGAVYIDVNFDIRRLWEILRSLFEPIYTLEDLPQQRPEVPLRNLSECIPTEKDQKVIIDEDHQSPNVEHEDVKEELIENCSSRKLETRTGSSSLSTASENPLACEVIEEKMVIDENSPTNVEHEDVKGKLVEIGSTKKLQLQIESSSLHTVSENPSAAEMTIKQMVVDENSLEAGPGNAKSKLITICVKNKWPAPVFRVEEERGPKNEPNYVCSVKIEIPSLEGTFHMKGEAKSKKRLAEYSSAYHMIRALKSSLMSLVLSDLQMPNSLDGKKNLRSKKRKRR